MEKKYWILVFWIFINLCGIWNIYALCVVSSSTFWTTVFWIIIELINFDSLKRAIEKFKNGEYDS